MFWKLHLLPEGSFFRRRGGIALSFSSPAPTPFPLEFKTLPLTNFGIDSIFIPSNIIILVFFVKKFGQKRFCKILYQIYPCVFILLSPRQTNIFNHLIYIH